MFLNTRLDGIGRCGWREQLRNRGFVKPGALRQRLELPLQVGGKEASLGWPVIHGEH